MIKKRPMLKANSVLRAKNNHDKFDSYDFTYAKKGCAKIGPNVRKIRRFAKVVKMAIFQYIAKGLIRQKCEKNGPIFGAT